MDIQEVLNVMITPTDAYNRDEAIKTITAKLDPSLIKQRDAGFGKKLDYISQATVVKLLNKAFGYTWSFQILSKEIIKSEPKFNKKTNELEEQPPYVEVLGRLTVPGLGVKEQYGTKIILGGASEQEGATKSAATDAMKKCATLFGIGLELYDDDSDVDTAPQASGSYHGNTYNKSKQQSAQQQATSQGGQQWTPEDTKKYAPELAKLKELREKLGITTNYDDLNPFIQDYLNNPNATWRVIGPSNIKGIVDYLQKIVDNM